MRRTTNLLLAAAALALTGCLDPIVGAACQEGLTACGKECVDLDDDLANCGACGNACDTEFCVEGVCSEQDDCIDPEGPGTCEDAGPPDANPEDPDADPTEPDASMADANTIDAGPGDPDANVDAAPIDAAGDPDALVCDPLLECNGMCVDSLTDPDHCGTCGNDCPSGICILGDCLGGTPGHVVIIGHDYRSPREGMNRLLGNSVFLNFESFDPEVRVLSYRFHSTNQVVAGAEQAIDQVATELGRTWSRTVVESAAEINAGLPTADVLLIHSQNGMLADDAELIALGTDISVAVNAFIAAQGIVIVLDGVAPHGGTYQVAQAAGLFTAGGRTTVTGQNLDVVVPGDSVGSNVPLVYAAEQTSVSFDTSENVAVVEAPSGEPVVVHRTVF